MTQTLRYKLLNNRVMSLNNALLEDAGVATPLNSLDYLLMLRTHYVIMLVSIFTCTLVGLICALLKTPTYEATMLLQVGPSLSRKIGSFGEALNGQDNNINVVSETELIKSRAVIGATANDLALHINARPKYFPVIGRILAATSSVSRSSIFPLLQEYCWGAERIEVKAFDVPDTLLSRKFKITLKSGGDYTFYSYGTRELFEGRIGIANKFSSKVGDMTLQVASVFGQTGQSFILERRPDIAVIENLQRSLSVSESAKSSNMIHVAFKGDSPISTYLFLRSLSARYLEISGRGRTESLVRSMVVANLGLTDFKRRMEIAERKYNDARRKYEVANVGDMGAITSNRLINLKEKHSEILRKHVEFGSSLGPSHPLLIAINEQLRTVDAELANAERQVAEVPAKEEELQNLARDAKINADLYTALLLSAKELSFAAEKYANEVRIVDPPAEPTERSDSPGRIFVGCMVLGIIIGISSALIMGVLQRRAL